MGVSGATSRLHWERSGHVLVDRRRHVAGGLEVLGVVVVSRPQVDAILKFRHLDGLPQGAHE